MAKLAIIKTKETTENVEAFIQSIKDDQKRKDSLVVMKLMQKLSKEKPKLWSNSMIGFGKKIFKSNATGREVEWLKIGFAPRKANLSLHLCVDVRKQAASLKKLGKHKTGVGCIYINSLADVDLKVLEKMIVDALKNK